MSAVSKYAFRSSADPKKNASFKVEMTCQYSVDAVYATDMPSKLTLRIKKFQKDGQPLLFENSIVTATNVDNLTSFLVDGQKPSKDVEKALSTVVTLSWPDQITMKQRADDGKKHKVGETWPLENSLLMKSTRLPFAVHAEDFSGEGKILNVDNVGGQMIETIKITSDCQFAERPEKSGSLCKNLKKSSETVLTVPMNANQFVSKEVFHFAISYTIVAPNISNDISSEVTTICNYKKIGKEQQQPPRGEQK